MRARSGMLRMGHGWVRSGPGVGKVFELLWRDDMGVVFLVPWSGAMK